MKKVSIITVVYNAADTIADTIESVLSQRYGSIEYIVIDGGSGDGTLDVLAHYSSKIDVLISEPDGGIYHAMNKGLELATGDIVGFINADDFLHDETCIEDVVNKFGRGIDAVYGDKIYVHRQNKNKIIRHWKAGPFDQKKYKSGWMTPHLSTYIDIELYKRHGGFNLEFQIAADYELMLRLFYKENAVVEYVPRTIACMRVGGVSNRSLKNILFSNYEVLKSWWVNDLKVSPFIIILKPLSKIKQYL